ncbi:MAG: ATP-binding protein [Candidatus Moraniibacteriota bacterium]
MIDFQTERKIEANRWIIKARWFYMAGILLIGLLTKTISKSNVYFTALEMVVIVITFVILNLFFFLLIIRIEKQKTTEKTINLKLLSLLSHLQIISELITFTYVMHKAGGIESMSSAFFFLPIVSASLLFGLRGSVIVAIASAILINTLVVLEYLNYIPHIYRYGVASLEASNLSFSLTKTITTSVSYLVLGTFAGYSSKLLLRRENMLKEKTEKLNQESWLRVGELKQLENSRESLKKALDDLQEAKSKTEEEKNKTLAIVSNFTDPIIVLDKDNKVVLFNLAAKLSLGLRNEDLGREVPHKDDFSLENFKSIIRKGFEVKKIKTDNNANLLTEELYLKEDAKETTYKVITVNIKDDAGNYTGVMKIFYDFTREKIIDKMKSDFISIAAHQLRTPLSAIKWSTGMIIAGDAGPINIEQENLLHKSYASNEIMITLVNDLLNVSRIEEGRFGYNFKNGSIQEILDTVIENAKQSIEKGGIKIIVDNEDKHTLTCLDKNKMALALQNIFDNAIKYTPRYGTINVTIKKSGDGFLVISIKDSGVGIPKNEQGKIFSKFFRATNVILMETEGTGLGLFIVKNIIEKHGGIISLASEENKGTEVIIKLPIECKM